jgi:hypothetical protein
MNKKGLKANILTLKAVKTGLLYVQFTEINILYEKTAKDILFNN